MSQTIVTSNPLTTYAGEPIWTSMSLGRTEGGGGKNGPSSMSGGTPISHKTRIQKILCLHIIKMFAVHIH